MPKVNKAAGLQTLIENYIIWNGGRATRVNNIGRLPDKEVKTASGAVFTEKRYTNATRRGQADVSSTIHGRSVMWEVKIGNDRPSQHQIDEQARERQAGGEYEFVKTPEDFFTLYDYFVDKFKPQ